MAPKFYFSKHCGKPSYIELCLDQKPGCRKQMDKRANTENAVEQEVVWGSDVVWSRACCGAEHGVRENMVLG